MSEPIIVDVIGAGLAGVEASWQLAKQGIRVRLHEMKRIKKTPAQSADTFAELVCSNSFRSDALTNAAGLLKEELRMLGSIVIEVADRNRVPAGSALAVDRVLFSEECTRVIQEHPLIEIVEEEVVRIPDGFTIIATGPLTSDALFDDIRRRTGEDTLYFFDAAAPIVEADSINMDIAYFKSRYDKGEATYINCPMSKEEYDSWYKELINAECVIPKDFELKVFEGCMPIEEMARRGEQTLLYGPMKPVGLRKPDGTKPYAVVQLRQDNLSKSLYNIVGFQTHMKFPEQLRLIRMIPGLEKASIVRYGVMHRNSYLNAPKLLSSTYQFRSDPRIFFAGQLSGVEGYVESIGSAVIASLNMARLIRKETPLEFPRETAIGSQAYYISNSDPQYFQPMNANFGIIKELEEDQPKKVRKERYAERSIHTLRKFMEMNGIDKR